jgi:heme exporter protein C
MNMKKNWYKYLAIILLLYAIVGGLTVELPVLMEGTDNIKESMRNVFYHVGMWFAMMAILFVSVKNSIQFLSNGKIEHDHKAEEAVKVGLFFGLLGILTGMFWAKFTWGAGTPLWSAQGWWANDPNLNGAVVSILIYFAYMILRSAIEDEDKRARTAAVYNIFAFAMLVVFIGVLPKISETGIHPGKQDSNIAFGGGGMSNQMRMVFWPALIGWMMLGIWITNLKNRIRKLEEFIHDEEEI